LVTACFIVEPDNNTDGAPADAATILRPAILTIRGKDILVATIKNTFDNNHNGFLIPNQFISPITFIQFSYLIDN
jgi:hypothetical protein